jgi:hypothetical protein
MLHLGCHGPDFFVHKIAYYLAELLLLVIERKVHALTSVVGSEVRIFIEF